MQAHGTIMIQHVVMMSMAGLLLWSGGGLVLRELSILGAREVHRQEQRRTLVAPDPAMLAGAVWDLGAVTSRSDDIEQAVLELEMRRFDLDVALPERRQQAQESLERAEQAARKLVGLAPLSGTGWCALADFSLRRSATAAQSEGARARAEAARLVDRCRDAAPMELRQIEQRAHLALDHWDQLPAATQAALARDIVAPLRESSEHLARQWVSALARALVTLAPHQEALLHELIRKERPDLTEFFGERIAEFRKRISAGN